MKSVLINNFGTMNCTVTNLHHNLSEQQQQLDSAERTMLTSSASSPTIPPSQKTAMQPQLSLENVMPGINLTKDFITWSKETLLAHGFTHIIIIDKHIQELYYPSAVCKSQAENDFSTDGAEMKGVCGFSSQLDFGKEFKVIDLNFGEKSYLTTVLPNCYRAVNFIHKALQSGGSILVIDCNGGEQKCLTIIVAYLMYKNNISFDDAFLQLKGYYKKADLDRFYTSQLYEYEPILKVQRAQSRGHSCSRELHSALLKRKYLDDDHTTDISESADNFLHTLNPLTQFHPHQQQEQKQQQATTSTILKQTQLKRQLELQPPTTYVGGSNGGGHDWDDYVME